MTDTMSSIFITGGTGFIGSSLIEALLQRGDSITLLTRRANAATHWAARGVNVLTGDPTECGDWQAHVARAQVVINLAGRPIAGKRWDARERQMLQDGRVDATRYIVEAIGNADAPKTQTLINASGIDYYPFTDDLGATLIIDESDNITETAPPGDSFLARLCRAWEAEATVARELGVRVVLLRAGLVFGKNGGSLARMTLPFRMFIGGRISHGRQWVSWIHLHDAVRAIIFAIDTPKVSGPLNLVAPVPCQNAELSQALGRAMKRPSWIPVPAFAVRAAVGELSEYLLNGRRAVPAALLEAGFVFEFGELDSALHNLLG